MVWVILAALGIPLWLCALGILSVVVRNRAMRKRHGDIPVRVRRPGKKRWTRGHAIWISDVFAWRGSPAAWNEDLRQVNSATLQTADPEEGKKLHRLGKDPVIASFALPAGESFDVATSAEQGSALLGPFAPEQTSLGRAPELVSRTNDKEEYR